MRVLITGERSYIGTSFKKWADKMDKTWQVDMISVRGEDWRQRDFSGYDAVLNVAGIAHVSTNPKLESLYYKVNRDLAIEIARKAKQSGVKQYIFISSMILYPDERIGREKVITDKTMPNPQNFYGKSKLEAERAIQELDSSDFHTAIIRAPMVYGPGSKGNFQKLIKFARLFPVFPSMENKRSMIYIDNLCEFIRLLIVNKETGVFFPQNKEYVRTRDIVQMAAADMGKKVWLTGGFNFMIKWLGRYLEIVNKIMGNKIYDRELSGYYNYQYCVVDFEESIRRSVQEEYSECPRMVGKYEKNTDVR